MPYTPNRTGYRNTDTSALAAVQVEPKTKIMRDAILAAMKRHGAPVGADELAEIMDVNTLAVRPRLTELRDKGLIRDTGPRGQTNMGKSCILWEVA